MADTLLVNYALSSETVTYNGYSFPIERTYSIEWEDVYDEADRVVIAKRGILTITGVVTAATASLLKTTVTNIDCLLNKPGKPLTITGTGLTDISIQSGDLKWGPKPRRLLWEPLGGNIAASFAWECEIYVDPCCGGSLQRLMALNMTASYSADYRGLVTRTLRGYLQAYQRATTKPSPDISVDSLWSANYPPVPKRFQRMHVERNISSDNTRLDFTITDQELESPDGLPPGIVKASMPIYVRNLKPQSFKRWSINVSGTFETAVGYPLDWGFRRWLMILADYTAHWVNKRTGDVLANYSNAPADPNSLPSLTPLAIGGSGNASLLMQTLAWGRDVFTRVSECEASFIIVRDLADLQTGIWSKVPGCDFDNWQTSLKNFSGAWKAYGASNVQESASTDVLVTVCAAPSKIGAPSLSGKAEKSADEVADFGSNGLTYSTSWLEYENRIESNSKQSYNYHTISQEYLPSVGSSGDDNPTGKSGGSGAVINAHPNVSSVQANIIEYTGSPKVSVTMVGRATRVRWYPEIPQLLTVGGMVPREVNRWSSGMNEVGQVGADKVYTISWRITYVIDSAGLTDLRLPAPPDVFSS